MTTVQAWQHIYSNVEKDQSPKGRGGFQTLFYSQAGLTEDDISEMEGRLLYFPAKATEPIKRLFFNTASGKAVVAQIVVLPDPDQYGRKGRYLAHALAFTPEDFAKFEADPFRVFRSFKFFTVVSDVLAQGDFATGDIGSVTLQVSDVAQDVQAAESWSTAELKKLMLLALRVESQTVNREAITFSGEPSAIEEALEAAFLAVPTVLRPQCIFDTYFYKCNLVATFYWSIGLLDAPASIKFASVDSVARKVQGEISLQPVTAYERWGLNMLDGGKLETLAAQRNQAFGVSEWLDGRKYDEALLDATETDVILSVFDVNAESVQSMLRKRVDEHLPDALIERTSDFIYHENKPLTIYQYLREGFALSDLVEALYLSYEATRFQDPSRGEVKALQSVLEKSNHNLLQLFMALWRGRRELPEALQKAEDVDYEKFVDLVLKFELTKPLELLVPNRATLFLNHYLTTTVADWVGLVKKLLEVEAFSDLSRIIPNLPHLSRKELNGVKRLTTDQDQIPVEFSTALDEAIQALPPEGGIKGFLKSTFRRLPGLGSKANSSE